MVVSVLPIAIRPGAEDDLAQTFFELEVFEHAHRSGGFRGGRLLRPLAIGEPFLVIAEWEDAQAYQNWLDNPVREELKAKLDPLVSGELAGGVYEEV